MNPVAVVMIGHSSNDSPSDTQLQAALGKCTERHPLLSSCIRIEENDVYFVTGNVPPFKISRQKRIDGFHWLEVSASEPQKIIDWKSGPLVRFQVLEGDVDTDILITGHHSLFDGLSLSILSHDLLNYLSDPEYSEDVVVSHCESEILPSVVQNVINSTPFSPPIVEDVKDARQTPEDVIDTETKVGGINDEKISIVAWILDAQQTSAIISAAKKHDVTVHSVLSTARLMAVQKAVDEMTISAINMPIVLNSLVNTRNYLAKDVQEALGCYISLDINFGIPLKKDDFWVNAMKFNEVLTSLKNNPTNLFENTIKLEVMPAPLVDQLSVMLSPPGGLRHVLPISNIGHLKYPITYGNEKELRWNGLFIILDTYRYELTMMVCTLGGQMHFSMNFRDSIIDSATVKRRVEIFMKTLADVCDFSIDQLQLME